MKRNTHKLSKYEGRHRKDLTRASCYWKFLKEECIMKTYRLRAAWIPVETGTPWSLGFLFSTLAGGVWFWGTFALILHLRTPQQPPCAGLHGVQWRWRPAHRPTQQHPPRFCSPESRRQILKSRGTKEEPGESPRLTAQASDACTVPRGAYYRWGLTQVSLPLTPRFCLLKLHTGCDDHGAASLTGWEWGPCGTLGKAPSTRTVPGEALTYSWPDWRLRLAYRVRREYVPKGERPELLQVERSVHTEWAV